jgi:hypothetical protein
VGWAVGGASYKYRLADAELVMKRGSAEALADDEPYEC